MWPKHDSSVELAPEEGRLLFEKKGHALEVELEIRTKGGPPLLDESAIKGSGHLVQRLTRLDKDDRVSEYIWSQLSAELREQLGNDPAEPKKPLPSKLFAELNALLQGPCIYNKQRSAGIKLPRATASLVRKPPLPPETAYLNRWLLEHAYPSCFDNIHSRISQPKARTVKAELRRLKKCKCYTIHLGPLCQFINREVEGFREAFKAIRESGTDPNTIRHAFAKGITLGKQLKTLVENHQVNEAFPEVAAALTSGRADPQWQLPAFTLLAVDAPVIVFGPPGAGKTTLLRRFAIEQVKQKPDVQPLFVRLSRVSKPDLAQLLSECCEQLARRRVQLSEDQLLEAIRAGTFRLFLDGLDETGESARSIFEVIKELSRENPHVRVVVSSREFREYGNCPDAVPVRLAPFSDTQVSHFIDHWFRLARWPPGAWV
jgi:hypothetical protein